MSNLKIIEILYACFNNILHYTESIKRGLFPVKKQPLKDRAETTRNF
jgi:hypothetical protein